MTLEQWEQLKEGSRVTHKFTGHLHTVLTPDPDDLRFGVQRHRFQPDGLRRAPIRSSDMSMWEIANAND